MGKPSEAKAAYEHAAAAKQTSSEALYYQALALQEVGNSGEATKIFETLVTTRPPQVRNSEPSNEAAFEVAMTERKRLAEEHYRTGLGYLGKGSTAEAQAEFQKALSLDPAHIGASAIAKP